MGKTKLHPVIFYLTDELKKKLKQKQAEGYSASFLARKFLTEGLAKMNKSGSSG